MIIDQHSELDLADDFCWVYVYEGDAASITPDDICTDTSICPAADRPLLATPVLLDTATGDYVYNTGFIYPGLYTVALVCEADDPDADEDLLFMSETEVQANAVAGGAQQDLALVEVPILTLLKTLDSYADNDSSTTITAGDVLTYRMIVGNAGNVTLTTVTLTDLLVGVSAPDCGATTLPASLAPAATLDCTATYTVVEAPGSSIVNTASASADQDGPVDSSVTVDVAP